MTKSKRKCKGFLKGIALGFALVLCGAFFPTNAVALAVDYIKQDNVNKNNIYISIDGSVEANANSSTVVKGDNFVVPEGVFSYGDGSTAKTHTIGSTISDEKITLSKVEVSYLGEIIKTIQGSESVNNISFNADKIGTYKITYTVEYNNTIYSYDYTVECEAGEANFEFKSNDKNIVPSVYDTKLASKFANKDIILPLPTVKDEDDEVILDSDSKEYYTLDKNGADIVDNQKGCYVYINLSNGDESIKIEKSEDGNFFIDGDSLVNNVDNLKTKDFKITYTFYQVRDNGKTFIVSTEKSFKVENGYYYTDSKEETSGYDMQVSWSTSNKETGATVGVEVSLPTVSATTKSTNTPANEAIDVYYDVTVKKMENGSYSKDVTSQVITKNGKFKANSEGSFQVIYAVYDFYGNQAKLTETNYIINATDKQQANVYMYDAKTNQISEELTEDDYKEFKSDTEYKLKSKTVSRNIVMYAIAGVDNMVFQDKLTLKREIRDASNTTRFSVTQSQYHKYNLIFAPSANGATGETAVYKTIADDNYEIRKQMILAGLDPTDGEAVKKYIAGSYLLVTTDGKDINGNDIIPGETATSLKSKVNDENVINAMIEAGYAYVPSSSSDGSYKFRDGTTYEFRYIVDDNHSEKTEKSQVYSVSVTADTDESVPSITFSTDLKTTYQKSDTIEFDVATATDTIDTRLEVVTAYRYLNGNKNPIASEETTQTLKYVLSGKYSSKDAGKWYVKDVDGKGLMESEGWYFDKNETSYKIDLKNKPSNSSPELNAEYVEILCYAVDDSGNIGFFNKIIKIADASDSDIPEIIKITNAPDGTEYDASKTIALPIITYKDERVDYMSADVKVYKIIRGEDGKVTSKEIKQSLNMSTKANTQSKTYTVDAGILNASTDGEYQVIITVSDAANHTVSTYFTYNVIGGTVVEEPAIDNITSETLEVEVDKPIELTPPTLSVSESSSYGYIGLGDDDDANTSTWYTTTITSEYGNNNGNYDLNNNFFTGKAKGTYKLQYEVYLIRYSTSNMTTSTDKTTNQLYLENGLLKVYDGSEDYYVVMVENDAEDAEIPYKLQLNTESDGITGDTKEISEIEGLSDKLKLYVLTSKVQTISVKDAILTISVDGDAYSQTQYPTIDEKNEVEIVKPQVKVTGADKGNRIDYETSTVQITRTSGSSTQTLATITLAEWENHFIDDQNNRNFRLEMGSESARDGSIWLKLLDNGNYTIKYTVQAVNYLGEKVGDTETLEFSISNGDVISPEIDLDDDFIKSTYKLGETLKINMAGLTVTDETTTSREDLLKNMIVEIKNADLDESEELENEGDATKGEYIYSYELEKAGDYTLTITISDEAGNKTTKSVSFTVSTETSNPVDVKEVLGGVLIAVSVAALAGVVIYFVVSKVKLDKKEKKYRQDSDEK